MKDTKLTERGRRAVRACVWMRLGLLVAAWIPVTIPAGEPVAPESVKAAFLFRFGEYVEWPAPARPGPVVIAVLNESAVADELRRILPGRSLQGRAVVVHEVTRVEALDQADILYIGRGTNGALKRTVAAALRGAKPLLVVTDAPDGLQAGAAINFVMSDNRIRFEVSPAAAQAEGVKLSSRLLGVAVRVAGTE